MARDDDRGPPRASVHRPGHRIGDEALAINPLHRDPERRRGARRGSGRRWRMFAPAALALLLLGAPAATAPRPAAPLRVFAAASLSEAFAEIAGRFGDTHAGLRVQLNVAGSQQLASQIEQGAAADVFAAADPRGLRRLEERGRLADMAVVFARNRLVVVVPRTNPGGIRRLQDLARPGIKLVLGAETVPVGMYAREALHNLTRVPGFTAEFPRLALANVVSEEENVKAVAGKVRLGEADAGIVYRSDVTSANARWLEVLEIPAAANVLAAYPIAALRGPRETVARQFVRYVLSAEGQRILRRHGFVPVAAGGAG